MKKVKGHMSRMEFERFIQSRKLQPVGKVKGVGEFEILLAECFETNKRKEYPSGYYQVVYGVCNTPVSPESVDMVGFCEFDALHDLKMALHSRSAARVSAAVAQANKYIQENLDKPIVNDEGLEGEARYG